MDLIYTGFENGEFFAVSNIDTFIENAYAFIYVPGESMSAWDADADASCQHAINQTDFCFGEWRIDVRTGSPVSLAEVHANPYDCRSRPWYRGAATNGTGFSDIYVDFNGGGLCTTAAQPLLDASGHLRGVAGIDFFLDSLSDMLTERVGESHLDLTLAIVEAESGNLIAASAGQEFVTQVGADGSFAQVKAVDCADARTAEVASFFETHNYTVSQLLIEDHRFLLAVMFTDEFESLSWVLMVSQATDCDYGYYEDHENMCCSLCQFPLSSEEGTGTCDVCVEGYYWSSDPVERCKVCPVGTVCEGIRRDLLLRPGYWRTETSSVDIRACPMGDTACAGGFNSSCATGYVGHLCNACDRDYFVDFKSHACVACANWHRRELSFATSIIMFVTVLCCIAALVYIKSPRAAKSGSMRRLKYRLSAYYDVLETKGTIIVFTLQVIYQCVSRATAVRHHVSLTAMLSS